MPATSWAPIAQPPRPPFSVTLRPLCTHFQLTGEHLQDLFIRTRPSVCGMTMTLTMDPLLLVTKQAAFIFLSKLAFNKTGYLATAKAKEPQRRKKAVARDGACLRWAARHVSGCIQGKHGRDSAWLFLYHEAKLFGSCPEGQLPQSLGKAPVVCEMFSGTEVGERITDLHKYRWYEDGWEMTWSQFLVWCEPCLVHP